jgi:hypothetical protein
MKKVTLSVNNLQGHNCQGDNNSSQHHGQCSHGGNPEGTGHLGENPYSNFASQ